MMTLRFKTTMKCDGCVQTVTPFLNEIKGIENWKVDLYGEDKLLTIEGNVDPQEVIRQLQKAGYKAVPVEVENTMP
jgi:copper chaperone